MSQSQKQGSIVEVMYFPEACIACNSTQKQYQVILYGIGVLGISRDNWHKRRATGGKKKALRKKRKYELGRPPANTKV